MTLQERRQQLCHYYEIERDENGKYTSITVPGARTLLGAQLDSLIGALKGFSRTRAIHGLSDDDYDYTNAVTSQLEFWHELEFWTMDNDTPVTDRILAVLNMTPEEARNTFHFEGDQGNWYALKIGFADHASPMSTLAHMNDDD